MLHIERAATGLGDWHTVHAWLQVATRSALTGGVDATLLFGTPALAFVLHGAAREPDRYRRVMAVLDASVTTITARRLAQAHARIDQGERPALGEFDLFSGLTGLGVHLRRRHGDSDLFRQVLTYLVRLTHPLAADDPLPGWWTAQPPTGRRAAPGRPGGHANLSMAHGICGPLALLSLAVLDGVTVEGQLQAIETICSLLDRWRQDHDHGPWWPEVITLEEARSGRPDQTLPGRPSWCYGTPGHARAQQLAAMALSDPHRQRTAEHAITGCLTDPTQLRQTTDPGLCHGTAGLFQTAWRIAADTPTHLLGHHLSATAQRFLTSDEHAGDIGLLNGTAGWTLALMTAAADRAPLTNWDAFMLLT
jgi:hypothetical protein